MQKFKINSLKDKVENIKNINRIIEIKKITDILNYVNQDSLVVFDIDNTLIQSVQEFGGQSHFFSTIKRFKKQGLKECDAIKKSSVAWTEFQDYISYKTVEQKTVNVIETLKNKNIKSMALTARWSALAKKTVGTLKALKLAFDNNSFYDKEIKLGTISCLFKGILFTGDEKEKGESLILFFEKINYIPKHVLFIDDSIDHVESVYKSLDKNNIPCVCMRYSATDEREAKFDPEKAEKELLNLIGTEHYNKIFSEL